MNKAKKPKPTLKKPKRASPKERLKVMARCYISPDMTITEENRIAWMVAFENLKLEFPAWAKRHKLNEPSEFEKWKEIVEPEDEAEEYYGIYYYSGLQKHFKDDPGKPEQYLTPLQILKLVLKYEKGRKEL
jgi:hypothetical protein